MARVPIEQALADLERPTEPRPEFADALLRRLLAELEEDGAGLVGEPRRRLRPRRYVLAAAAALAVIGALVGTVLLARPSEASAADVIEEAQQKFAAIPSFHATVFYDLNPEGISGSEAPAGATAVVEISYRASDGYRHELREADPALATRGGPGSFYVWDGERLGTYSAAENTFSSFAPGPEYEPLRELSWNAPYPNWEELCRLGGSEVLPDAHVAGRSARHVRCGDFKGGFWQLWIDRETGLILKLVGQVGADDFKLGTSPRGGFEVTSIESDPDFPPDAFSVVAPPGSRDETAEREAALANVPPLRVTYSTTVSSQSLGSESPGHKGGDWIRIETVGYRDASAWRLEVIEDSLPDMGGGGAGSFTVWNGEQLGVYTAVDNTFSLSSEDGGFIPILRLAPWADAAYDEDRCDEIGKAEVAARPARHLACDYETSAVPADVWLDAETGLYLRIRTPDYELEVKSIEYEPSFVSGTFEFVPPPGSRDIEEVSQDPYAQTDLVRGEIAPVWSGPLLDGGTLALEDLRGRPVLVFFWADWCDKACFSSFSAFQEMSRERRDEASFISVDFRGSAAEAEKIIRNGGYSFRVVDDGQGTVGKSWGVEAVPLWVLLDEAGRVVEVRLGPQTIRQLEELLAAAG